MELRLLRNATLVVRMAGRTILVDPILAAAGELPPIPNSPNPRPNPLVGLPLTEAELSDLVQQIDIVLVTHTHPDHWDRRAIDLLPPSSRSFANRRTRR